jgi:hypothetical protein
MATPVASGIQVVTRTAKVSEAEARRIAEACHIQLRDHVAPAWNIDRPLSVSVDAHRQTWPCYLVSSIPEAPGALAYHDVDGNGKPYIKVGVTDTLANGDSVSSATSHEMVELQCDIWCQQWCYSSRLQALVATEACDPVQAQTYEIEVTGGHRVEVSNFVTPGYFVDSAGSTGLDHLGKVKRPFAITAGGYRIDHKGGRVTEVYGRRFPPAKVAQMRAGQGRTFWRHVTMALSD